MTRPIPDGSVVITPAQMYQQIGDSAKQVEKLTGEVAAMRSEIAPAFADVRADVHDHENRLRTLERGHWTRIGASSLVSALISSGLVAAILELVKK